jgi:isoquinoline 1-oxidoreductase alpha subunit
VRVRLKVLKISAVAQVLRSGPALDSRLFVDARAFVNLGGSGMSLSLMVNGIAYTADVEPETPLLWVLRDSLKLTGTKFGCGIAQCGACTVLIDGQAMRSCSVPVSAVAGKPVTTIEGLSAEGTHPVQLAWIELDVPQCGYCQSGQIMAAVALLKDKPKPTDEEINREMTNICRCGTYPRIRAAIHRAAELQA